MSQINKRWLIIAILMALLVSIARYSSNSSAGPIIDPDTGKHRDHWIEKHQDKFIKTFLSHPDKCEQCHGSDPVLRGGISDVSCFNSKCHNSPKGAPVRHVVNGRSISNVDKWVGPPPLHGRAAKAMPSAESGFAVCQACHGTSKSPFFGGGVFGPTCFLGCHGPALSPHPNAWLSGNTYTHSTTDVGNAPVCKECHLHQNNLSNDAKNLLPTFAAAPKGTPPGCFNSTLCHGAVGNPHPVNWSTPTVHGPVAKAAPGATSGFQYCQVCHGPFTRGGSFNCQTCHGVVAPHPADWLPGDSFTHTTTDVGNAPVCANCHRNTNPGTPGCFNNTLCHGAVGNPHPDNWSIATVHGPVAKAAPGATSGFQYCQVCHGPFTRGGSFNCQTCHGVVAPHPADWLPGDHFVHTTTDQGNARVCANCHTKRAGTPGCFNNTLCHGAAGNPHPKNWPTPTVHGPVAKAAPGATSGFQYCNVCHGPFTRGGSFNCQTCHGIVAPHPADWLPGDPFVHTTTNQGNAAVCANCHRNTRPGTPGCFNNTLCHGADGSPHPRNWPTPTVHGPVAKAAPGATSGFQYCNVCHGPFTRGGSFNCQTCHGIVAPHPSAWGPDDTYTHTTTKTGNAAVCANCHRNTTPGTPGCFNNTLCHGAGGNPHPDNWPTPTVHGPVAKAAPGAISGFQYCQVCHGPFNRGGTFNCQNCHVEVAPHPSAWEPDDTYTHTTTKTGNAAVCANCHRNINPGTPGCFNNTLCHGNEDIVGKARRR